MRVVHSLDSERAIVQRFVERLVQQRFKTVIIPSIDFVHKLCNTLPVWFCSPLYYRYVLNMYMSYVELNMQRCVWNMDMRYLAERLESTL